MRRRRRVLTEPPFRGHGAADTQQSRSSKQRCTLFTPAGQPPCASSSSVRDLGCSGAGCQHS